MLKSSLYRLILRLRSQRRERQSRTTFRPTRQAEVEVKDLARALAFAIALVAAGRGDEDVCVLTVTPQP